MSDAIPISIIIPTRNGQSTIGQAIESVLIQTYPHFELIVLESGSTDATRELVLGYDDPRIRLLSTPEALGIVGNWGRILQLSLHPYMMTMCHDDYLYPDFLGHIAEALDHHQPASLVTSKFDLVNVAGQIIRPSHTAPEWESAEAFLQERHKLRRDVCATGFVIRSEDYCRVGGMPPFAGLMYADEYVMYRLSLPGGKLCLPKPLFAFRVHERSAGHTVSLSDLYQATGQYLDALEDTPYSENDKNRALARAYASYRFSGQFHRKLYDLGRKGTAEDWARYDEEKTVILADAATHHRFTVYDWVSQVYESAGRIRWKPLRVASLSGIGLARRIRQAMRELRGATG